jgi:hypothetical protein
MKFITNIFLCLCLFVASVADGWAQNPGLPPDTLRGANVYADQPTRGIKLEYGLNMGAYFANKYTANYYNGSGNYSSVGRQGNLEQIIGPSSTYNYPRIRQQIGYDFVIDELPSAMSYSPAMMVGLFATISFSPRIALLAESNFSRLRIQDQFTIKLTRFSSIEGDNIERHGISGSEERVDIRLGIQYTFHSAAAYIHPFFEAGGVFTDTKVKDNTVRIGGSTLSMYVPGTSQYMPERDYGIGLGGFLSAGIKMDVTEQFKFSVGYSSHYNNINLGKFDEYKLQHSLFIRFNMNNLLR